MSSIPVALFRRRVRLVRSRIMKRIRDEDVETFESIAHAQSIVGFRNRLAHGYDSIDDAIVWGVISGHLPLLLAEIEFAFGR